MWLCVITTSPPHKGCDALYPDLPPLPPACLKGDGDDATAGDAEGTFFRKEELQGKVARYVELLKFKVRFTG